MGQCILALGRFGKQARNALSSVADKASLDLRLTDSVREAHDALENEDPRVLLVDDSDESSERLCLEARAHVAHAHMPIISVTRQLDDLSFAEVFSWGGDDAITASSTRPLLARLRFLPKEIPPPPTEDRGTALVCDPDQGRRIVLARVLRNAGYGIQFALTCEDVTKLSVDSAIKLVIVDAALCGEFTSVVAESQAAGSNAHWILTCPPKDLHSHLELTATLRNTAITDGYAPPENVVFLSNDLIRGGTTDNRSSRRLLYGTRVSFRGVGGEQDEYGFSYNISEGGLYVRTLAPPDEKSVWIELRPPRSDQLIRLEGEVVWRRRFGPSEGATVPPGFGFRLTDATKTSMEAWLQGYQAFSASLGFRAA